MTKRSLRQRVESDSEDGGGEERSEFTVITPSPKGKRSFTGLKEKAVKVDHPIKATDSLTVEDKEDATSAQPRLLSKGSSSQIGPQKSTNKNIRVSTRIDYQPYLCKDYNETGYCGFGDSCIYVHDRGDYKTGWELEQEWEAKRTQTQLENSIDSKDEEVDESQSSVQKDCLICEKGFTLPIVQASCGHLFCESCAIKRFIKNKQCISCHSLLNGQFKKFTPPTTAKK